MACYETTPQRCMKIIGVFAGILFLCSTSSLFAQKKETLEEAVPGKVRVKIARSVFKETMEPDFFGTLAERYGIGSVTPWLNRDLLRYMERNSGLYRRNGNLGGSAFETPAHSLMRIVVVEYSAAASPEEVARALAVLPGVEYAEPIWHHSLLYTPNDPRVEDGQQWHLETIRALEAWDIVRGDSTVLVAITDTGIERDHSDLKAAIWHNPGEYGDNKENNNVDDDGNGLIDDWWGYDFAGSDGSSPDNDPSPGLNDHGVHVAGIAGAVGDNDIGGAGVAFGVRLMAVKISDDGADPELPAGFEGMMYAAIMGADVINCSWGAKKYSTAEQEVVNTVVLSMGVPVICAAGNDGENRLRYPAGYDNVLSVAATRSGDIVWEKSNYNYNVDICAPGGSIYSTFSNNQFGNNSGTSMASPVVAGAAALIRKQNRTLSPAQVYEVVRATADNIDLAMGLKYKGLMGSGRLNLGRAIERMNDIASARMVDYVIEEETSDGVIEAGEGITVRATVRNILAPATDVNVTVTAVEPLTLPIDGATVNLGPMGTGATAVTPAGSIHFVVPADISPNSRITLKVTTTATAGSENRSADEYVTLIAFPTFATTQMNNIALTFNSVGNLGYNGTNRTQGEGFLLGRQGSLMWHGGLMMGTAQSTLVDVARRGPLEDGTNNGFAMTTPYRLTRDSERRVEIGRTTFTDHRDILGVDVELVSYEFTQDYHDSNMVIAAYKVTNRSGATIENLHCGLYLDWDLQENGTGDQASYDEGNQMGFVRNKTNTDLFIGSALLSNQTPIYYAVNNLAESISSSFTNEMKWRMLSSGTTKQNTPTDTDVSMVIGGGPVTLADGESETFVFGLMGAKNFLELQQEAVRARERYMAISSAPGEGTTIAEARVEATPNPFSDETSVMVQMPVTGDARLEILDLHGNRVGLLHEGRLESGEHTFRFDSGELPSGVYFYRLQGDHVRGQGQMILVR